MAQTFRVPILGDDGRLPDKYTPQQVVDVAATNFTANATQLPAGSPPTANVTGTIPNLGINLGIPAGQPSTYELRGTGSPYNVVTPPGPGYFYTDTAGTCGAWRWRSTGTSKTSWVVVDGSTGWRDISSTLLNGFTGYAAIKRTLDRISVYLSITAPGGASEFLPIPMSFRPLEYMGYWIMFNLVSPRTGYIGIGYRPASANLVITNQTGAGTAPTAGILNQGGSITYSWDSTTSWPTVLPGVAV